MVEIKWRGFNEIKIFIIYLIQCPIKLLIKIPLNQNTPET